MRVYLSNIRQAWPVQRQEADLDTALPGWRKGGIYRDEISAAARRKHVPADLRDRADMLRPTRRQAGETVHVASLAVLAWTLSDLMTVLAALAARRATLVALAEDVTVPPDAGAEVIATATAAFERSIRRSQTEGGRRVGAQRSREVRMARAQAACDRIRDRWPLPSADHPTADLLKEAGVSVPTANRYLGLRPLAQKRRLDALAREAKRKEKA